MATGDLHTFGTFFMNETKQPLPTKPWRGMLQTSTGYQDGNIPQFVPGHVLSIRDSDAQENYRIKWREISRDGKKIFICDRLLLRTVSYNDLDLQSLIIGKLITIDGKRYKLRVLTGGLIHRDDSRHYLGGTPSNNEWDMYIGNELSLPGIPTPTANDIGSASGAGSGSFDGTHNIFWNWYSVSTWAQEEYNQMANYYAIRGSSSAKIWAYSLKTTRSESYGWRPVLEEVNATPTITVSTTNNKTLYENENLQIDGTATDTDNGDIVTVKYQINSGTVRNLHSAVSDGVTPIEFLKSLTYKDGVLKDGATNLTSVLVAGTPHVISVWAEDGNGGKSAVENRTFYVVPNRPPSLNVDPIAQQSNLINSNVISVNGSVVDLDNNDVVVTFQINDAEPQVVLNGAPGAWAFNITLKDLKVGTNTIVIKAVDIYGASITKVLTINKTHNAVSVNQAVALYKITPPTGSAQKILMWIERMLGDLSVTAEISMTNTGEAENFVSLPRINTAPKESLQEDEFAYDALAAKEHIILKIIYNRTSSDAVAAIKKISGVLS